MARAGWGGGTLGALLDGLASGSLSGELWATVQSYVEGLALAVVIGVPLGIAIGSSRTIDDATSVVIEFLRPIPAVALIPLAILVLGLGTPMLRFVTAYAALWPILIHTIYGVRGVDRMLYDVAATSGVGGAARIARVTIPAALCAQDGRCVARPAPRRLDSGCGDHDAKELA